MMFSHKGSFATCDWNLDIFKMCFQSISTFLQIGARPFSVTKMLSKKQVCEHLYFLFPFVSILFPYHNAHTFFSPFWKFWDHIWSRKIRRKSAYTFCINFLDVFWTFLPFFWKPKKARKILWSHFWIFYTRFWKFMVSQCHFQFFA